MSSEEQAAAGTWSHDFGDLGTDAARAAAELVELVDGVRHLLGRGGSFGLWARVSGTSPGVVELGCFDLAGVDTAWAAGLGRETSGAVAGDIRAWLLSGEPMAPWRKPAPAGHSPALELSWEWRERNRELRSGGKGEGDGQAGG